MTIVPVWAPWAVAVAALAVVVLLWSRLSRPGPFLREDGAAGGEVVLKAERRAALRLAALVAVVTWVPLLVLAILEGSAHGEGGAVPFLADVLPYGEFLVGIPILLICDVYAGRRSGRAVAELRRSDLLAPVDTSRFSALVGKIDSWWSSRAAARTLALLTAMASAASVFGSRFRLTEGWSVAGGELTLAGWWLVLVSLPVLRFLLLRWVWRYLLWTALIWRTSRFTLRPRPSHPDGAGGMAFLGDAQTGFNALVLTLGVRLSCQIVHATGYEGADPRAYLPHMAIFAVIAVSGLVGPLAAFTPRMVSARAQDLIFLSGSGYRGAQDLHTRLEGSAALPTDAVSGLTDFGQIYDNARRMLPLPLDVRDLLRIGLTAVAPFGPLVFLVMPAEAVLETLARLLV